MPRSPSRSAQLVSRWAAVRRARPCRRWAGSAVIPALLVLGGCHYASSPLVGFGNFVGDTHTFHRDPNLPTGSDETLLRSQGRDTAQAPLLPEGGNIWPGPPPPEPSLSDIQKLQDSQQPLPPPDLPRPAPNGSSTPPAPLAPTPVVPTLRPVPPPAGSLASPRPAITPTPGGPLINNGPVGAPGGISTGTAPGGGQSIIVPNGNGTSTVIAPDGSTQTVPTPR